MAAMAIVLVVLALAGRFSLWRFLVSLALVWVTVEGINLLGDWLGTEGAIRAAASPFPNRVADWPPPVWVGEGYETVRAALALWRENPLFGGGLGAFLAGRLELGLPLAVIRGSFAWALGEMGVVGTVMFFAPIALGGVAMARLLSRNCRRGGDLMDQRVATAYLAMIFLTLVMSVFHDLAYQRDFWLLSGAFLAAPGALVRTFRQVPPTTNAAPQSEGR
jgi:hypothetical protein